MKVSDGTNVIEHKQQHSTASDRFSSRSTAADNTLDHSSNTHFSRSSSTPQIHSSRQSSHRRQQQDASSSLHTTIHTVPPPAFNHHRNLNNNNLDDHGSSSDRDSSGSPAEDEDEGAPEPHSNLLQHLPADFERLRQYPTHARVLHDTSVVETEPTQGANRVHFTTSQHGLRGDDLKAALDSAVVSKSSAAPLLRPNTHTNTYSGYDEDKLPSDSVHQTRAAVRRLRSEDKIPEHLAVRPISQHKRAALAPAILPGDDVLAAAMPAKVPLLTILAMTMGMAMMSGFGALPFLVFGRLSAYWSGLANAAACGVMLAASFGLLEESKNYSTVLVMGGMVGGVVAMKLSTVYLSRFEDMSFQVGGVCWACICSSLFIVFKKKSVDVGVSTRGQIRQESLELRLRCFFSHAWQVIRTESGVPCV